MLATQRQTRFPRGKKRPTGPAADRSDAQERPPTRSRFRPARIFIALALVALLGAGGVAWRFWPSRQSSQKVPLYGCRVVKTLPHQRTAYCQGLTIHRGTLFESTGKYGESSLRTIDLATGKVQQVVPLDRRLFGEGLAVFGDRIYQLTWKEGVCLVYDRESLKQTRQMRYEGEGWGLTHNGEDLIMSDGGDEITFRDPGAFAVKRRLRVTVAGRPMRSLNELEYIDGEIWANVYTQDYLVRIDPDTGNVTGRVDCRGLLSRRETLFGGTGVLNGIAYDPQTKKLYVTGKNWPKLFQIELTGPR